MTGPDHHAEMEAHYASGRDRQALEHADELIAGLRAENERLRAAVEIATARLSAIRDGEAFQPHLHAGAGLMEIKDLLASAPTPPPSPV